jgi:hypothetical protein
MAFVPPAPPSGVTLSPVANKTIDEAQVWLRDHLELDVSTRYLKSSTDADELHCQIVAGRRRYSTSELYKFVVTRPARTAGRGGKRAAAR